MTMWPFGGSNVRKTITLTCIFALVLATWTFGNAEAASRCVPNKRFVVLSGGLVRDMMTNLVWQQQASTGAMTWDLAKTYCPSGFRLPTVKELTSLVDASVADPGPTIDSTAFPGTPNLSFWTSTPHAGVPGNAWTVYFGNGLSGYGESGTPNYVRCVR
jgi:hypothetical protein